MIGLCHSCLTSDVELINDNLCMNCYHKRQKQSSENKDISDPPTLEKLKEKWNRKKK